VGGWKVEARLLRLTASRRCDLAECRGHCCGGGVWIDVGEAARIVEAAGQIKPHLPVPLRDEELWFDGVVEADADFPTGYAMGTRVQPSPDHPMGSACVFLRPDFRCALQVAGNADGEGAWKYKPYYCALHPITRSGPEISLDAENEIYIEGGCCHRPGPEQIPMYLFFERELRLAMGDDDYKNLQALARDDRSSTLQK